jgi:hypothetical protein
MVTLWPALLRWLWTSPPKSPNQVGGFLPFHLRIAAQNCNSLNVSTSCEKQLKKLTAILELNSDIIFLSDLRLSNATATKEIEKVFACNQVNNFRFFHNSSKNSRGTGILLSNKLDFNCVEEYRDREENILAMH